MRKILTLTIAIALAAPALLSLAIVVALNADRGVVWPESLTFEPQHGPARGAE